MNNFRIMIEKEDGTVKDLLNLKYKEGWADNYKKHYFLIFVCTTLLLITVVLLSSLLKGYLTKDYTEFIFSLMGSVLMVLLLFITLMCYAIKRLKKMRA